MLTNVRQLMIFDQNKLEMKFIKMFATISLFIGFKQCKRPHSELMYSPYQSTHPKGVVVMPNYLI